MIRFLLVLVVLAVFVLCAAAMWWGWHNRARRQAAELPPFPEVPGWWREDAADGAVLPVITGVYLGTTTAGNWQDRIAVGDVGFRAAARLALFESGLMVSRTGASPLWIPVEALRGARTDRALAGKVMMSADGLLVVRWQLGDHLLDTGFRGDNRDAYPRWVAELDRLAGLHAPGTGAQGGTEQ